MNFIYRKILLSVKLLKTARTYSISLRVHIHTEKKKKKISESAPMTSRPKRAMNKLLS